MLHIYIHPHIMIDTQTHAVTNVQQRISMVISIINDTLGTHAECKFTLDEQNRQHIINQVHGAIGEWNGIQISNCKSEKNDFNEYLLSARNWFDRSKSKIYGNHLFYPLIFEQVNEFVLKQSKLGNNDKLVLFLDMLKAVLSATIKFKGAQCLPLIPLQTFTQPNSFLKACSNLCKHYEVEWDLSTKAFGHVRNSIKSKSICDSFVAKLDEIKKNIRQSKGNKKELLTFGHSYVCTF